MSDQQPAGNGRNLEVLRWVIGLVAAVLVSYFTAIGAVQRDVAVVAEREAIHYTALKEAVDRLEAKIDRALAARP